jgi:hypothetical protein
MPASPYPDLPSVADVAGDVDGVLARLGRAASGGSAKQVAKQAGRQHISRQASR